VLKASFRSGEHSWPAMSGASAAVPTNDAGEKASHSLYERPALTESECIDWVASLEFEAFDTDGDDVLSRGEIKDALRIELGRDPSDDELQSVWVLLDSDYNGVVSKEEFEEARKQQHLDASVAAGGARAGAIALMRTMLRSIPQMPAVKFFRPKPSARVEGKDYKRASQGRLLIESFDAYRKGDINTAKARRMQFWHTGSFVVRSTFAGVAMFWTYGAVAGGSFDDRLIKLGVEAGERGGKGKGDGEGDGLGELRLPSSWMHCLGGALGGAVHATIVCPALIIPKDGVVKEAVALSGAGSKPLGPGTYIQLQNIWQWLSAGGTLKQWMRKAYRPLPFVLCRDALSYGAFFGAYDCAVRYLTPRDTFPAMIGGGAAGNYGDDDGTLPMHTLPLMGRSVAAGAAAGMAFHTMAYPFQAAVGNPRGSSERLRWMGNTIIRGQASTLYKGVLHNSWPSIVMGALTFLVYDTVLRTIERMDP